MYIAIFVILLFILLVQVYLVLRILQIKSENQNQFGDLKFSLNDNILKTFNEVSTRLIKINEIQRNNETMLKTFSDVSNRLVKIDEAQKNIDKLSVNILDFKNILTDKKTRGIFGETQLNQILFSVFGDEGDLYKIQYHMGESKIVDAAVFTPEPLGIVPIDSKFPLENYIKIENKEGTNAEFVRDVKKHITDISEKYLKLQGINQAIMFIPAESIYTYILSNCTEVINYAYDRKVWIASPMSLMAILTTIQMVITNQKRNEISEKLYFKLKQLEPEFNRYKERWESLVKNIEKLEKDVKDINVTTKKIGDKFERIKNAE